MRSDRATWIAWTALALGSALPAIVWRWVIEEPPAAWLPGAQALALAAALPLLGRAASRRPLRGLVLAIAALQLGLLLATLVRELSLYADWADDAPEYQTVFVSAFLLLIPGLLMLLSALLDGLGRGDLFLERGEVAAPSLIPGTTRRISWRRLGPILIVALTVPLALQLAVANDPDLDRLEQALVLLPLALVFGAVNALSEELRFRCVLLARLVPVAGAETALWMTALLFGLAHWYGGNPSGPSGVALTTLFGLLLAKSMLETRGLFWAWAMHGAADVVIFTFLVLSVP